MKPSLRLLFYGIVTLLATPLYAETLVTEAKILEVTERGFILKVGTEPLAVEDSPETKLWKGCAKAERKSFGKDETVSVRIKTDTDPPLLREMADANSWKWLDQVRRQPSMGTIEKITASTMRLKLADGKFFEFRISNGTSVTLKGKQGSTSDLEIGQTVYVKGRLGATLETYLEKVTDEPIPVKATATSTKKEKAPPPIPSSGKLEGTVLIHLPPLKMFDIMVGNRTLHISYRLETKFTLDGRSVRADKLTKGQDCIVHYTRDKAGRILASKVELFTPRGG